MGKMELSVTPNLIPRLLSAGALRRADSHQELVPGKKWMEWVLYFSFVCFRPARSDTARRKDF